MCRTNKDLKKKCDNKMRKKNTQTEEKKNFKIKFVHTTQ